MQQHDAVPDTDIQFLSKVLRESCIDVNSLENNNKIAGNINEDINVFGLYFLITMLSELKIVLKELITAEDNVCLFGS